MAFSEIYRKQVALLIRIIPLIAPEDSLALKGGTAINLFIRDMPRLSVDIDLTYLPVLQRDESLSAIDAAMNRIAGRIQKAVRGADHQSSAPARRHRHEATGPGGWRSDKSRSHARLARLRIRAAVTQSLRPR
jgi:predicted nucleotidyltransferase component of viral defense system